ncbi:MAG: hypothetical protein A3D65_00065 [Candidatus Lloydbacteria bacterium RIFCSPHIGHO2_02_FULL_50_13]|uniref:NYN domain-containing protein n=1 Tax=Candidatus Lloydbacteria bacterium RIFCSPHIGHO2_02_FULL_50_13 TaxID=1798661 RepID=A0A1G2D8J5_9BACT|nr:MAG: hypothetical protein A3D65_00065 [Candidatus Lloydbacteria bacterium RIFCSPHIGHO2_02_FULL_50_13]
MKTVLLIDGENLKGKMKFVLRSKDGRILWHEYDFRGLLQKVLTGISVDRSVFYFAHVKTAHRGTAPAENSSRKAGV